MKKLLFIALVVCSVSSCLGDSTFANSYMLDMTFEDVESYSYPNTGYKSEMGADSLLVVNESGKVVWADPSLALLYKQEDKVFKGGFRLSRLIGEADGKLERPETDLDMWRVTSPGGAYDRFTSNHSKTYAVWYNNPDQSQMPLYDMEFGYQTVGTCAMSGCYVNNTTYVARKIKELFEDGDKLMLIATGYDSAGDKTGKAEMVLAEYSALRDSVVYNWTPFNLSSLGAVTYVDFDIVSSRPEIPECVCIDGVVANISISY